MPPKPNRVARLESSKRIVRNFENYNMKKAGDFFAKMLDLWCACTISCIYLPILPVEQLQTLRERSLVN